MYRAVSIRFRREQASCSLGVFALVLAAILILARTLLFPNAALAERLLHTKPILENVSELASVLDDNERSRFNEGLLRAVLRIQGEGRLVLLARVRRVAGTIVLLHGAVSGVNRAAGRSRRLKFGKLAGTLSREGNSTEFSATFFRDTTRGGRRYYKVSIIRSDGRIAVSLRRASHFLLTGRSCGLEELAEIDRETEINAAKPDSSSLAALSADIASLATLRRVDLISDTDKEFTDRYGGSPTSRISSLINSANVFYVGDLGIELNHQSSVVNTSSSVYPSTMTNAYTLLNQYHAVIRSGSTRSSDINVLFTGKDLNSSIIGLAGVGTICRYYPPTALVQRLHDAVDHIILAHEIGHSFSAGHTSSGIMGSSLSISNPPSAFSADSIVAISTHISRFGSCLTAVSSSPTPSPTPSATATPLPTSTPTASPTVAVTPTPGASPTNSTPTPTATPSSGGDAPGSATPSPTPTSGGSVIPPDPIATPVPDGGTPTPELTPPPTSGPVPRIALPSGAAPNLRVQVLGRGMLGRVSWSGDAGDAECSFQFHLSPRPPSGSGGTVIGETLTYTEEIEFYLPFRSTFFNRRGRLYLGVVAECDGVPMGVSKSFAIRSSRIAASRLVTARTWIRQAKRHFYTSEDL